MDVKKREDRLLDAYSEQKQLATMYERQLDRASDLVFTALERKPGDPDLLAIGRALTE